MPDNPIDHTVAAQIADFLEETYREEIETLIEQWADGYRSLVIDCGRVADFDKALADDIVEFPNRMRDNFLGALQMLDVTDPIAGDELSSGVTIRFWNVPNQREVGEYRPRDTDTAMTIVGQLAQISAVKPVLLHGSFVCQRCGTITQIPQPKQNDRLREPHECQGCERQGPFRLDHETSEFRDRQLIQIKTPPEDATDGKSQIKAIVNDELAGEHTGDVGSRVAVTGVLTLDESDPDSTTYPYLLDAEDVELRDGTGDEDVSDEELAVLTESDSPIEDLTASLLPGIETTDKLELIKEALVLQLVGSPRANHEDGARIRGDWHMLLLGDPGTAKSEIIDEAHRLAPRSEIVGERVTAPGMTVSATEDGFSGSQWSIKAGVLVRANDGLCAIDEIDKISDDAVQALHNPMERQRVDASLADQSVSLPAYTAILAAGNPKYGRFDKYEPVPDQIDFDGTLLSRFDLIFLLQDEVDAEHDAAVGEAIAKSFLGSLEKEATGETDRDMAERNISSRIIRGYISRAREVVPTVEDEHVWKKAVEAYTNIRQQGDDDGKPNAVPVTARKQEGIFRLAASSARARLSETIEVEDVERAVKLIRQSLEDVGIDPETGEFDADVIETGTSMSQHERMKSIKQVVEELSNGSAANGPTVEDIAAELDVTVKKANKTLEKLAQQGDVYRPQEDHYRTT
jgi:replicative DNA helicase Mcm